MLSSKIHNQKIGGAHNNNGTLFVISFPVVNLIAYLQFNEQETKKSFTPQPINQPLKDNTTAKKGIVTQHI
jgi:hypothetical protein